MTDKKKKTDPDDNVDREILSAFVFVGFGWRIEDAYVFKFSIERQMDPDEAFEEARVQFSRLYPRCGAAVFYKSDAERPDKLAVLYDVHDSILNNAGVKDANELVFDR